MLGCVLHVEGIYYYWRSRRSFIDAWYTEEELKDCDSVNTFDDRDLPRRRSCPGFVTLWEQRSENVTDARTQSKKAKVNNQRKRRAMRRFDEWVLDTENCSECAQRMWKGGPGYTDKQEYHICRDCKTKRHSSSSFYCDFCESSVCIVCARKRP